MRGLKSTLALLVVLIGLGAYIYFVAGEEAGHDASRSRTKLFRGARGVEDRRAESEVGVGRRHDAQERRRHLEDRRASPGARRRHRCHQPRQRARRHRDRARRRRKPDRPEAVRARRAADRRRVQVGRRQDQRASADRRQDRAPAATCYAKRDDQKRVVLIAQYHESSLNKSTFDLRDKTIIKFDRDKVDGVDVNVGGKTIEFAKADADWKMTKPVAARADFSAVDGLIGQVKGAQMKTLVDQRADAGRPEELRIRQAAGDRQPASRQRASDPRCRRQGRRHHDLRPRRVEAGCLHGREQHRRRSQETGRRLPEEGAVRLPRLQCDARRADAERSDGGLRARQGEGRQIARHLASRQPESRRSGSIEGRKPARRPGRHPRHVVRRLHREDRTADARAHRRREVRRRQEGGEGHVRQERIRRLRLAARRSWRRENRSRKIRRSDQGTRRALKMTGARGGTRPAPRVHTSLALGRHAAAVSVPHRLPENRPSASNRACVSPTCNAASRRFSQRPLSSGARGASS